MCCTLEPAELSNTILYAGEATINGEVVHVLGYQNKAMNLFRGPNAMILPFPAEGRMGADNVINTSAVPKILSDYFHAVQPRARGMFKGVPTLGIDDDSFGEYVEVFDTGKYTVVLAADARDIPNALRFVPEAKRPAIKREIFNSYAQWYPNWPIALCCFEAGKTVEDDPLVWWYKPKDASYLFLPALDAHSGNIPDLKATVQRDHTLVVGTTDPTSKLMGQGGRVRFSQPLPKEIAPYFATAVLGENVKGRTPNRDFIARTHKVRDGIFAFESINPAEASW